MKTLNDCGNTYEYKKKDWEVVTGIFKIPKGHLSDRENPETYTFPDDGVGFILTRHSGEYSYEFAPEITFNNPKEITK
ncbi:MAG: hypothetical protein HeimC3_53480 [Candidatus Heimdallarchaeota archaeon LC_3]|nr:MAG: hypothetical protein HeimC3_53480 [Candidatus Heimdallarchaeota archaeon LC_3]